MLEEKWKRLENERARSDVISTIMSSTPGAVVLGDYVIEPGYRGTGIYRDEYDSDDSLDDGFIRLGSRFMDYDLFEDDGFGMHRVFRAVSPVARAQRAGLLVGRGTGRLRGLQGRNGNR